jgi:[ribosomal protein S18]-alanine N-acetyltransferase
MPSDAPHPVTVRTRRATVRDLQRLVVLEHECFAAPWPTWMIRQELGAEDSTWLVAEVADEVVGYVGLRVAGGEGHISTLGVADDFRGRGLGEALMLAALQLAAESGADCVVLEYRESNVRAAGLYAKLGFEQTRIRRGYYHDNGEDAVEVILNGLDTREGRERLAALRDEWETKHGQSLPLATSAAHGIG